MCSLCPSKPSKSNSHEKNLTEGESCGGAGVLGKGEEGKRGPRQEAHTAHQRVAQRPGCCGQEEGVRQ